MADLCPCDRCGCCGREAEPGLLWCTDCLEHVGRTGPEWERTYFALHGRDCPYQQAATQVGPSDINDLEPGGEA